jgi:hypothetical protein
LLRATITIVTIQSYRDSVSQDFRKRMTQLVLHACSELLSGRCMPLHMDGYTAGATETPEFTKN